MAAIETTILSKVLDWVWIVLSFGFVYVFRKLAQQDAAITVHTTKIALINQHDATELVRREEERELRDRQRDEILEKINSHHKLVMEKLDRIIEGR